MREKSRMQIMWNGKKDASTGTQGGRLSNENDEMFLYIENTESLMARRQLVEQGASGDKNFQLPLRKSLFAYVPQYIVFKIADTQTSEKLSLPPEILKHLFWKSSGKLSPRVLYKTLKNSGFTITKKSSNPWIGTWSILPSSIKIEELKTFQKINRFPGVNELSNKILLWKNFRKMRKKFGNKDFNYMPHSFIVPEESSQFRRHLKKAGGIWIIKPPNSCAGQGIRVISRYCEIPRELPFIVQNYLVRPKLINDLKFDLRLYALLTSLDPLRIYLYSEGLIRFATKKYLTNVRYLFDKFMHLTNTSINKFSPFFKENDSIESCKGNMWSLHGLWTYLAKKTDADIPELWELIKDIIIKTIISAEDSMINISSKKLPSSYNAYQLFGFDIILDENLRPWLLEVNSCPSMEANTPLCAIVKGQLSQDFLNLVGFHLPDTTPIQEMEILSKQYGEKILSYDHQLHDPSLTDEEIQKQERFLKMKSREDYLESILEDLTTDDVRILIRHEDEKTQSGRLEKIFPTCSTHKYFKYFQVSRYYNMLLDSWENTYGKERKKGVAKLKSLCRKKYHLRNKYSQINSLIDNS